MKERHFVICKSVTFRRCFSLIYMFCARLMFYLLENRLLNVTLPWHGDLKAPCESILLNPIHLLTGQLYIARVGCVSFISYRSLHPLNIH